jgi:histidinol-phosphate aminotransferase
VFVCNPNNPTGTAVRRAELIEFLRAVPSDVVVALDEAYREFVTDPEVPDGLTLLGEFDNVIVLRTFSKAYGLAGLRIGYGVAAPDLARTLWAQQLPFGIASTCLLSVAASYNAEHELQQRIRAITAERRYLRVRLGALGVYTTDAHANFVYLAPKDGPWHEVFGAGGPHVRHYPDGGARITVGNRASTLAVLSAVGKSALVV